MMTLFEKMRTGLRYLPMAPVIFRWKNLPITPYLARYKNEFLREVLKSSSATNDMSALVLVMVLAFRTPEQHRLCRRRLVGLCDGDRGPLRASGRHRAV